MIRPVKLSPIHYAEEKWQGQFVDLAGWQVVQMFSSVEKETAVAQQAAALCDQSHNGKIRIEGQNAAQLLQAEELAINQGQQTDNGYLVRLRHDLFFMSTEPEIVEDTAAGFVTRMNGRDDHITITDTTHGNAELWLVGPDSAELLSRLCGLDFHESQFPNNTAKQSSVAKTSQLIIRHDLSVQALPAYAIIGARSFGTYLWQTILEAGADLGLEPMGQAALNQLR